MDLQGGNFGLIKTQGHSCPADSELFSPSLRPAPRPDYNTPFKRLPENNPEPNILGSFLKFSLFSLQDIQGDLLLAKKTIKTIKKALKEEGGKTKLHRLKLSIIGNFYLSKGILKGIWNYGKELMKIPGRQIGKTVAKITNKNQATYNEKIKGEAQLKVAKFIMKNPLEFSFLVRRYFKGEKLKELEGFLNASDQKRLEILGEKIIHLILGSTISKVTESNQIPEQVDVILDIIEKTNEGLDIYERAIQEPAHYLPLER